MPQQPAALPEEIVEEILLRFPADEPASLVRASVVCKAWCRFISGPSFRRRFRELHRTPPMLGFLCSTAHIGARFVPTTASCPPLGHRFDCVALDARHGRVLLQRYVPEEEDIPSLWVWDPIADEQWELPIPPMWGSSWSAAVLCAGAGGGVCHHLDCRRGPFLVVFVSHGTIYDGSLVCTYSSDVDAWSEPIRTQHPGLEYLSEYGLGKQNVLLGNALYFGTRFIYRILKYSLESREMSVILLPSSYEPRWWPYMLTTTEEGVLGLVTVQASKLCVWLRNGAPEVDAGWTQSRVIDLKTLLPLDDVSTSPALVGLADGLGIVFMTVENDLYTIDLQTCEVKLYQDRASDRVVPYMSFYTPELEAACTGRDLSVGGSIA